MSSARAFGRLARVAAALVAAASAGCGTEPVLELAAEVRISASLSELVTSLDVYVLGPRDTANVLLTCAVLTYPDERRVEVTDPKIEVLGHRNITFDLDTTGVTLPEIAAGDFRLVYVAALDATDTLVGEGCKEEVTVESGVTNPVTVTIYPYTGG